MVRRPGEEQCIANNIKTRMRHDTSETLDGTSLPSTDKPNGPVPGAHPDSEGGIESKQFFTSFN